MDISGGKYSAPNYVFPAVQVFGQILLMLLFLYPLSVHKTFQKTAFQGSNRRVCVGSGSGFQDIVLCAMKRTLCCTVACVISDRITLVTAAFVIPPDVPRFAANVLYDTNVTLNVRFILLSFDSYK